MKYFFYTLAFILFCTRITQAQMGPISLSLDLVKPTGDFAESLGFGYGATWGYEDFLSNKVGLSLQLGSTKMTTPEGKSDTSSFAIVLDSYNMLHAQLGVKYYFTDHYSGWYGMFQVGASRVSYDYEVSGNYFYGNETYAYDDTFRMTSFSVGYKANRKWDYSFRINSIKLLDSGSSDPARYVGVRIARTLFGDREERP